MKKLLLLPALLFSLLLAPCLFAQPLPTYSAQVITVPIVTAGGTSNSIAGLIDVRKQQNVTLEWTVGGATNATMRVGSSVTGVNWETNRFVINTAGSGATLCTNLSCGGLGFLRVDSVLATGTINATNTLYYGIKIGAP